MTDIQALEIFPVKTKKPDARKRILQAHARMLFWSLVVAYGIVAAMFYLGAVVMKMILK